MNFSISFWDRQTLFDHIDVAVIGSGIVGLNAAWQLKKKNNKLKIAVLERGMFPMGASTKNAGFACFGSPGELLHDLSKYSEEDVYALVEKRWKGLALLRKNLGDKAIDFKNWGGYEIFDSIEKFAACRNNLSYLNKLFGPAIGTKTIYKNAPGLIGKFGFNGVKGMLLNTAEGQLDTGKMMASLIKMVQNEGVYIINNFEVNQITDIGKSVTVQSSNDICFNCRRVIISTNGFAGDLLPGYPVVPARAQVLVTKPIRGLKLKGTFHFDDGYYYFRNIGNRVLFGGGRNLDFLTEQTSEFGTTHLIQARLNSLLKNNIVPYARPEIDMLWSGIMGLGPEKWPIIKEVSPNVLCAIRLGGMGVAIGSLVGQEVADMVVESL